MILPGFFTILGKLQVQSIKNKQILAFLSCKLLLDYMATFFAALFSKALTSRFFQALWFLSIMEKHSSVNVLGLIFPLLFLNFFMPVFFCAFLAEVSLLTWISLWTARTVLKMWQNPCFLDHRSQVLASDLERSYC